MTRSAGFFDFGVIDGGGGGFIVMRCRVCHLYLTNTLDIDAVIILMFQK